MGVPKLWSHCSAAATLTTYAQLSERGFRNTQVRSFRVGVDASIWMFASSSVFGIGSQREEDVGPNADLRNLFYKLARMRSAGLSVLLVFDGSNTPPYKRGHRMRRSHALTQEERKWAELASAMGAEILQAHGEAEAELASLAKAGLIDAVMTDDVDALVFGAPIIVRNTSKDLYGSIANFKNAPKGSSDPSVPDRCSKSAVFTYSADDILTKCDIDRNTMILVAVLSGGDYVPEGIRSLGDVTAIALGQLGYGQTLLAGMKSFDGKPESQKRFLVQWRAKIAEELRTNQGGKLSKRHLKLAEAILDENLDYPTREVIESYTHPNVTPLSQIDLNWKKKINIPFLVHYASATFEWSHARIESHFRNTLWKALLFEEIRSRALMYDGTVPRGVRERPPSTLRQQRLTSTLAITKHVSPPVIEKRLASPPPCVEPLNSYIKAVHDYDCKDSTENVHAYRVELNPDGFLPDIVAHLPYPDPFPDAEIEPLSQNPFLVENENISSSLPNVVETSTSPKKAHKPPAEVKGRTKYSHWMSMKFLTFGAQSFIDEYERVRREKDFAKEELARRKKQRGSGKVLKSASHEKGVKGTVRAESLTASTSSKEASSKAAPMAKGKVGPRAELMMLDSESSDDEQRVFTSPMRRRSPVAKLDHGKGKATAPGQSMKPVREKLFNDCEMNNIDKEGQTIQPPQRYEYIDTKKFLDSSEESDSDDLSPPFNIGSTSDGSLSTHLRDKPSLHTNPSASLSTTHISKSPKFRRSQISRSNQSSQVIELTSSDEERPAMRKLKQVNSSTNGVVKKSVEIETIDLCSD